MATTTNNTRNAAARYPVAVGDLRRASARIAAHSGENGDARRGMVASRDALKKGLGADDARTLAQRLLIGDSMMLGGLKPVQRGQNLFLNDSRQEALQAYDNVAREAHRLGLVELEGRALLRTASLLSALAVDQPWAYQSRARAAIRRITNGTARAAPMAANETTTMVASCGTWGRKYGRTRHSAREDEPRTPHGTPMAGRAPSNFRLRRSAACWPEG